MSKFFAPQMGIDAGLSKVYSTAVGIGPQNIIGCVAVNIFATRKNREHVGKYLHDELVKMLNQRYDDDPYFREQIEHALGERGT